MLTLDSALSIPDHVLFTNVDDDMVLLNVRTNEYFALDEVGTRFWGGLSAGGSIRAGFEILLDEFEVEAVQLELDLLELVERLAENGLVEIVSA